MTRAALTDKILAQKRLRKLSWQTIVAEIGGGSAVYARQPDPKGDRVKLTMSGKFLTYKVY